MMLSTVALFLVAAQQPSDSIARLVKDMEARPWTPPTTAIPVEFVQASKFLFAHGLADPSGGTLHRIVVRLKLSRESESVLDLAGWVLPELVDGVRVAVALDGLVYPVSSVGEPVTIADLTASPARSEGFGLVLSNDPRHYLTTIALLLRRGEVDEAERLYKLRFRGFGETSLTGEQAVRHFYGNIEQLSLYAFSAGADTVAFRLSSIIARHQPVLIERFVRYRQGAEEATVGGHEPILRAAKVYSESQRRLMWPRREGLTHERLEAMVQDRRADELISWLEEATAATWPVVASGPESEIIAAITRIGDEAVEPLIDAIARDDRLTRSPVPGRLGGRVERIVTVKEVALDAVGVILGHPGIGDTAGTPPNAAQLRNYWQLMKDKPIVERKYLELADDLAPPNQWLGATQYITEPSNVTRTSRGVYTTPTESGQVPPVKGEPLRDGRKPSVSELIARRVGQVQTTYDAFTLCQRLVDWDAHESTPALQSLSKRLIDIQSKERPGSASIEASLVTMSYLTVARLRLGDKNAIADYVAFAPMTRPRTQLDDPSPGFAPILVFPEVQEFQALSESLFGSSESPYHPGKVRMNLVVSQFSSRLLAIEAFRRELLSLLGSKEGAGTIRIDNNLYRYESGTGAAAGLGIRPEERELMGTAPTGLIPVRVCDVVAFNLARLEGAPVFVPVLPLDQRDKAILEVRAFVETNAHRIADLTPTKPFESYAEWFKREPFPKK